jgi:hypothetical protein
MYKQSYLEIISDTSQHWYLAEHTDFWMYFALANSPHNDQDSMVVVIGKW